MAEENKVERITLDTTIGESAIAISALPRNDRIKETNETAMKYLVWHNVPTKAFSKETKVSRDAKYSAELAAHLTKHASAVLESLFSDVRIVVTAAPEKLSASDKAKAALAKLSPEERAKLLAAAMAEIESETKPKVEETTTEA